MEASAIRQLGVVGAHGRSPLLRLQSDERLVGLVRRGNQHAFEALVSRYESRLLAFCRHMLSSREDAEDVLQEVFAAAFHAMLADDRPINVRPWLYRIARNRSLNHLRRVQAVGVDSMDTHFSEHGLSTAEKAHRREDFRLLISDVQELPETQRTALLLREIDALSYEQIAEAMDNTVPSVKSLLVRARVGLAEAAEARLLDCDAVRLELGEVAEGLKRISPPVRRHVRTCEQCSLFRQQLNSTNRQLAALLPVGPLLILKKTLLTHLGGAAAASGTATAGSAAGGALQVTINAAAGKAAAGLAAAAIVTAGAVEAKHVAIDRDGRAAVVVSAAPPSPAPAPAVTQTAASVPEPAAPVGAAVDPFATPPNTTPPALVENDPPADEKSAPEPETAPTDPVEPADETAATAAPIPAAAPTLAEATPVVDTEVPSPTAVPPTKPLGTPVAVVAPTSPMVVEGVVRPAGTALGTPATGVVTPGSQPKVAQPVVEAIPPAVVTPPPPAAAAPVPAAPTGEAAPGGEPTGAVEAPAAEIAPESDAVEPEPAPEEVAPEPEPAPAVAPEAPAPADVPEELTPAGGTEAPPADATAEPTPTSATEPVSDPAPTGGTEAPPASEDPASAV